MTSIPEELRHQAVRWTNLDRIQRRQLAHALRRLGLSYREISDIVPISKSTLSTWCREVTLTREQTAAIARRTAPRKGIPRDTQRKRRIEVESLMVSAQSRARTLLNDPMFVAGVVMYWAEGAKTYRRLSMSHSEPAALRLFINWVGAYLIPNPTGAFKVFLHAGNDVAAAEEWWRTELGWPAARLNKPYIKPDGTGHRKNHLAYGVCSVDIDRSTDAFYETLSFIEVFRGHFGGEAPGLSSLPGR
jgi:hypothetical protein